MSILIKNMEMPSCCYDCTFSAWSNLHRTKACKCGSHYYEPCFEDNSREFYEKRADFCPLIEVPAPHGDLINIDSKITIGIKDGLKVTTVRRLLNDKAVRLPKTVIEAGDGDAN